MITSINEFKKLNENQLDDILQQANDTLKQYQDGPQQNNVIIFLNENDVDYNNQTDLEMLLYYLKRNPGEVNESLINEASVSEEYILVKGDNIIDSSTDKDKIMDKFKSHGTPKDERPSSQVSIQKKIKESVYKKSKKSNENKINENFSYYEDQLAQINLVSEFPGAFQIRDGNGNSTKQMNLNEESANILVNQLSTQYNINK